jgi:hypothetical protein
MQNPQYKKSPRKLLDWNLFIGPYSKEKNFNAYIIPQGSTYYVQQPQVPTKALQAWYPPNTGRY